MLQGRFFYYDYFLNVKFHSSLSEGLLKTIISIQLLVKLNFFLWLNIGFL